MANKMYHLIFIFSMTKDVSIYQFFTAVAPDNNLQQTDAPESEQPATTHAPIALAVHADDPLATNAPPKYETTSQPRTSENQPSVSSGGNQLVTKEENTPNSEEIFRENTKAMEELFEKSNNFEKQNSNQKASKGRRRGVWKLVKHRPLEPIEESESQNYYTVLNMFDEIKKENKGKGNQKEFTGLNFEQFTNHNLMLEENSESNHYEREEEATTNVSEGTVKPKVFSIDEVLNQDEVTEQPLVEYSLQTTTVTESPTETQSTTTVNPKSASIFDSFYSMFDFSGNKKTSEDPFKPTAEAKGEEATFTTTIFTPTFPEEITESRSNRNFSEMVQETTITQQVPTIIPPEQPKGTFAVEPWEMKQVRTSTSTEISHETEICYKGRCIKSTKGKIKA